MVENSEKLRKMVGNDEKNVVNCRKLQKIVENDRKLWKMTETGGKF